MPPQIKQDLNRSGWETTDFPSVCENCLPENPYVQMLKDDYGAECKICTRPFTVFRWKADRTSRSKRTNICLTCARLKNCCQCCMLDLSFGLPIVVRDAALKLVAPGPGSAVNREYYAQEHEKEIEEGRGDIEAYEKTDEKARQLLRKLANSEPYYKKQRRMGSGDDTEADAALGSIEKRSGFGPIRTRDDPNNQRAEARGGARGGRGGSRGGRPSTGKIQLPPGQRDIRPPQDPMITSLFVTGVEDDLPEHALRTFFSAFGALRSLVCSHRSHCAFVNYNTRAGAENAADKCQGKAIISGCPLRVQWGRPRPLDNMDQEQRMEMAREGRAAVTRGIKESGATSLIQGQSATSRSEPPDSDEEAKSVADPPGQDEINYASLAGN
ncbi:MAG: Pre-mRNA-splicing factor slt11 [Vezdaea aestivalis]|nr:MAG: Pre-mRNA-splicing factor slt11 [Vezdaea aestivalis]